MLESTTKYAIKALLYLASKNDEDFVRVEELSQAAGVPGPYLSKIMKTLALKGIVLTRRGIKGGVKVAPRIQPFTFYDICVALDDPIVRAGCMLNNGPCSKKSPCPFHEHYSKLKEETARVFTGFKVSSPQD